MASQPQPLHPTVPCTSPAGTGGARLAGSTDKGSVRPKPPVWPKPHMLPKPAVPAKPPVPPSTPGLRHPRPELPSAEKMNRLAGPQPYSGAGMGGPLRRPSFTVRSPKTHNEKGLSSPPVTGTEEEVPLAPPTPSCKGPAPFKVMPVLVAARPEQFPGTTVEEILAKMDSREGPGSSDRAWLSPFCIDPSSRFGSKTFAAFRKRPSTEADGDPSREAPQMPRPVAGELEMGNDGHPVAEMSSSPPAGPSCARDPCGYRRPPSPPDLSTLQLGALGPPGSPRPPTCPPSAPGAPFGPAEPSPPAPGSPDAPSELLAPDVPTLPPGSPKSPPWPPVKVPITSIQAPGAPSATKPQLRVSHSPCSPHTPGEGSPGTASPPGTPELPPQVTCPPGSPEAAAKYLGPPIPPFAKASRPPGSPEEPDDSAVSPQSGEGPDFNLPPRHVGLRCPSEGVPWPPPTGRGLRELGSSLSALPQPEDLLSEPSLGSESGWNLSQSFEWTFPSWGAHLPTFPPRSPIQETPDSGLSKEGESDGEAAAPSPPKDSRSERPDSQQAEGAPCPGGPVAQREAEGSAEEEEEEREAEQEALMSHSPLHVTKPGQDPAEPESPTQPSLTKAPLLDAVVPADSAWAGDGPKNLQGPRGPGQAEGSSQDPDPHADPGWLTELLASPGVHSSPENLLGWSRKDLCSEFGIGHPRQDSTFDWSHPGVSRERDWSVETKQDQEFGTKSSWDGTHSNKDSTARESWSGDYRAAELMGDTKLGCSDWSQSLGTGKSCPQDPDFSASTAKWGQGYGSMKELGSGQANWGLGRGHVQELDKELRSGQPAWAGRYSGGDTEMNDRELTSDWASKYSSRDAGSEDKNLTLGWAGRSSTGDAGSPDKEFSPGRPAWDRRYNPRDMESQDWEFSPSWPAWTREYRDTESQDQEFSPSQPTCTGEIRDMESQDREFSPSRLAWDDRSSTRDTESQDREFSPSRPAWDDRSSSRDTESQDQEFSLSRLAEASECSTRDLETQDEFIPSRAAWGDRSSTRDLKTQDSEFMSSRAARDVRHSTRDTETWNGELFSPSRGVWDDRSSTRDVEAQDRELSPSGAAQDGQHSSITPREEGHELIPAQLSWPGEGSIRQTRLVRVGEDMPSSYCPKSPAQEPTWGSAHQEERDSCGSRDWAEELGGAECQNQFSVIGREQVPDFSRARASDGSMSRVLPQPQAGLHGDLSLDMANAHWSQDLDSWSAEPKDAEARRQEWASAFSARCAARSWDLGTGEQSLEGDTGTEHGSALSPLMGDIPADPLAVEPPWSESPSPLEEETDLSEPAAAPQSPRAPLLLPEAASGIPADTGSEEQPSDHPDGESSSSWGEQQLSLASPQPKGSMEQGQEFPLLEDTELLDSSVFRCKASLGRKRQHRAPSLRPTAIEGESWIFQDSTQPRPAPAASSNEEATEEPRSWQMCSSPSGRGVKVPLFPGLSSSAIKAKLRGSNRSAEEGTSSGDSKGTPPKDPHVQRSKSCKIPGVSGKPPTLAPKPEKSSGSKASSPHWLQALKLKRKKP